MIRPSALIRSLGPYDKPMRSTRLGSLCLLALALSSFGIGCSGTSAKSQPIQQSVSSPTATTIPLNALPPFSDWRAAYLGTDGHLHAVTLNGAKDVVGPTLPGMDLYGLNFASAGFSPDGRLLAYVANAGLSVLDVSGYASFAGDPTFGTAYQMYWSPDGSELALGDNEGSLWLAQSSSVSPTHRLQAVPDTPGQGIGALLGWIDRTHVAVTVAPTDDSITLGDLDVTTGLLRRVATVRFPNLNTDSTFHFSLSPDGAEALFFNERYRAQPYTPFVDLITIATGAITPLPDLAQSMGPYSGFTSVAWRLGTSIIAASTGFKENGDLQTWLLDVHTDTASKLVGGYYPMGWAPSSNTVVVSTAEQFTVGSGPFEIDAIAVDANGRNTDSVLTHNAMSFPFIGFVRTA